LCKAATSWFSAAELVARFITSLLFACRSQIFFKDTRDWCPLLKAGEKVGSLKASTAGVPADAVLRLGRGLAEQLISVRERSGLPIHIHDMYQKDEDEVLETVCRLCRESDRPLIVTAKNNERLCEELIAARQRGKRVVTLVSARSA
jgi:hypothetical protein